MLDIFLPIPCCWPDKREREIRRINSDIEKQIRRDKRESSKQYEDDVKTRLAVYKVKL